MKRYLNVFRENVYAFASENNILEEKDLGIVSDISSVLTPWRSVAALNTFQGCPYTNTGFDFDVRFDGERVKCARWDWLPNAVYREGSTPLLAAKTLTAVVPGMRSLVQKIVLENTAGRELTIPVQVAYRGVTRREEKWAFKIPPAEKDTRAPYRAEGRILSREENGCAYHLTSSLENLKIFPRAYLWEGEITLPINGTVTLYFSAHMGEAKKSRAEAEYTLERYELLLEKSFAWLQGECERIHRQLPRFFADDPALTRLYYRSLVTYILCRWENPDLCALPYFSTGSVNGSCMCSYLWDYCGGLMMHPIYDPEGNKAQLRAYLKNDLTKSYALNPVTAGAVGPWYQINQEKIILMVYHHVLATGDRDFLFERVGERTVLNWMRYHAYVCDDTTRENELYDYGKGGDDHLELFYYDNGPYNGVMPDLNARRYLNYMRVYELTKLAGQPDENLPVRAAQLKEKLKKLWNGTKKWYDFIDAEGNRDIRYTVQMFKFLNSPVIDAAERDGLVSHLNEREFLSKFGLHSMSKLDPQYDQDDIDNGGGGICTHFTMQICAQLYETGYGALATDILRRVYWWGERMPYMGDSCAANMILKRESTPLQGDISSVACAQMIFYYIFGIKPQFDGTICISPVKERPATTMRVENVRLCGKIFDVRVEGDTFRVIFGDKTYTARVGEQITL